jgi:hypothetical protein
MKLPRLQKGTQQARPKVPPIPPAGKTDAVQAAEAIAAAINQGLTGDIFCGTVNMWDSKMVRDTAAMELRAVIELFKENPAARAILDRVTTFEEFAAAFHGKARELYPQMPHLTV